MSACPTFDPIALWDGLSPQAQRLIGATFLAYELAIQGANSGGRERTERVAFFEACETALHDELQDLVEHNFADAFDADCEPLTPDLSALGIRQCVSCGCTDNHDCAEGCEWVDDVLCSRCAP